MTYVSPTPEEAYDKLEYDMALEQLTSCADDQSLCSAFQSEPLYSMVYQHWRATGMVPRAYDEDILSRVHSHINGCFFCQTFVGDLLEQEADLRAAAQRAIPRSDLEAALDDIRAWLRKKT